MRVFYTTMAAAENWSVRALRHHIERKTYERTAVAASQGEGIAKALESLTDKGKPSPDLIFKDPYFFDFLGLKGGFDEKDLEQALLRELESFILELGSGFAFVERQKRMIIDGEDFYLDLLFYHRRLRRLVAIELKLGRFKAAHKGQMELYLKWLDRHERQAGEEAPLGLILCAQASREQIELLELGRDGIVVAEYLTDLPQKAQLEAQLHRSLAAARERLAARGILLEEEVPEYFTDDPDEQ